MNDRKLKTSRISAVLLPGSENKYIVFNVLPPEKLILLPLWRILKIVYDIFVFHFFSAQILFSKNKQKIISGFFCSSILIERCKEDYRKGESLMKGRQHLLLGASAGTAAAVIMYRNGIAVNPTAIQLHQEEMMITSCVLFCAFGSIFPDVDATDSMFGRCFPPISQRLHDKFGHRGFVHTPHCGIVLSILLYEVLNIFLKEKALDFAVFFAYGYFLHLVQDTCTRGGIRWLWPLPTFFRLTRVKTNQTLMCIFITLLLFILLLFLQTRSIIFPALVIQHFRAIAV